MGELTERDLGEYEKGKKYNYVGLGLGLGLD